MGSRRAPGQRLINIPAKAEFVAFLDSNLEEMGYADRAKFIRDALKEKIEKVLKRTIPKEMVMPPGRVGKGGRRKVSSDLDAAPRTPEDIAALNDAVVSESAAKAARESDDIVPVSYRKSKHGHRRSGGSAGNHNKEVS